MINSRELIRGTTVLAVSAIAALGATGCSRDNASNEKATGKTVDTYPIGEVAHDIGRHALRHRNQADILKDPKVDKGYTLRFRRSTDIEQGVKVSTVRVSTVKEHAQLPLNEWGTYRVTVEEQVCDRPGKGNCITEEVGDINKVIGTAEVQSSGIWTAEHHGEPVLPPAELDLCVLETDMDRTLTGIVHADQPRG